MSAETESSPHWSDLLAEKVTEIEAEGLPFEEAKSRLGPLLFEADGPPYAERRTAVNTELRRLFPMAFTWGTPADIIARLADQGEPVPTGLPPLDKLLRRGGVPPGRVVVIGGPPGAGKTTLAAGLSNDIAKRIPVTALFLDEGCEPASVKLGQNKGLDRDKLEVGDPETVGRLRELLDAGRLRLIETEHPNATLETALSVALEIDAPVRMLVLDSVQTIRATNNQEADPEEREAISAFMWRARHLAKLHHLIIVITAQVARDGYKNRKDAQEINPLAMFAGSRAIEHASDVAIVLDEPEQESGLVRARVARNRIGDKGTFYLRLNRDLATLRHEDPEAARTHQEEQARQEAEAKWNANENRVVDGLRRYPDRSQTMLAELLHIRPETLKAVLEELVRKKKAICEKEGQSNLWRLTASRNEEE